ncbi:MAG: RNA polymerase sigma factor [Thermoleophilia bacterium]|nr:RNA polymerase sigma factor [Thermoleophilia bacterium]
MLPASDIARVPHRAAPSASVAAEANGSGLTSEAAFGDIWSAHHDAIFGYLASRVGAQNAEDIAVATFEAALKTRKSYDPAKSGGDIKPWLFGIATRQLSRHRSAERRWLLQSGAMNRRASHSTDTSIDAIDRRGALALALQSLPRKLRDAFLLHVLAELEYSEVASALDIPIGTVRSRINRARTALAMQLDGDDDE